MIFLKILSVILLLYVLAWLLDQLGIAIINFIMRKIKK